jgi:hypothetical protein
MRIRLWHVDPLPTPLRSVFELPEWPFKHSIYGPAPDGLVRYLQPFSVLRIEIQERSTKLMIPLSPDSPHFSKGEFANTWKGPYQCYTSFGDIHPKTLKVTSWNPLHPNFNRNVRGEVQGPGGMSKNSKAPPDNFAWFEWNTRIVVKVMNSQILHLG